MHSLLKKISLAAAAILAPALLSADSLYSVIVNTAPIQGQSGYLDFELGSGPNAPLASVSVTQFSTNGSLAPGRDQVTTGVAGRLPASVTLTNSTQFVDYFAGFQFGTQLSFTLNVMNFPATSNSGNTFAFGLYGADGATPLGANDGFGNSLLVQINPNGTSSIQSFNPAVALNTAVPEPASAGLFVVAALGSAALIRRRWCTL
jgi:hypothetical protein